jgi:RNA polymerase sigma-70 factor, ECF subfamily
MFFGFIQRRSNAAQPLSESFEELAVPLLAPLYNFARWQTRDHHEAEDLVQETYVRALKNFASFQPGTNFRAWMYRILRNTFLTSRAGARLSQQLTIDEDGEEIPVALERETPESILIRSTTQDQLQASLERLPAIYREVVLLCDVEEMKYQEIAELIEVPVGTVMSRIARARKLLRGMLAEERLRSRP